jgi:hypothetical protein
VLFVDPINQLCFGAAALDGQEILMRATGYFAVLAIGEVVTGSALAQEPAIEAVLDTYADIALAGYEDSLTTAKALDAAIDAFNAEDFGRAELNLATMDPSLVFHRRALGDADRTAEAHERPAPALDPAPRF